MKKIKQAVIFAGGRGARLMPLTKSIPKPLVKINDIPFCDYLVSYLYGQGFSKILFLTGYKKNKFFDHYLTNPFGIEIEFSIGKTEDETGTRLKNAIDLLDENFLLLYGDNFSQINFQEMEDYFFTHNLEFSTTVYSNLDGKGEYGYENNALRGDDGFLIRYDKTRKSNNLNCVDIGFFMVNKKALQNQLALINFHNFSFEKKILPRLIKNKNLYSFMSDKPYHYITSIQTMIECEKFLSKYEKIFPKLF
jgi:NDP-sugar pyrophosphorylase family protein